MRVEAGAKGGQALREAIQKRPKIVKPKGPGKGYRKRGEDHCQFGSKWISEIGNHHNKRKLLLGEQLPDGWRFGADNVAAKEAERKLVQKKLQVKEAEIAEFYDQLWNDVKASGLSLCSAEKKFGVTKQRMMRYFRRRFPEEYEELYGKNSASAST